MSHPSPALSDAAPGTATRAPLLVRCTLAVGWLHLVQSLALTLFTPMADPALPGLLFPVLAMGLLLQFGLGCGHARARFGYTLLLCATMAPSLLGGKPLVDDSSDAALLRSSLQVAFTAVLLVLSWLPGMTAWLAAAGAMRRALPATAQRKLARRGLWYGAAWIAAALLSLACADWFEATVTTTLLTFVPTVVTGGTLLAGYLLRLILLADGRP